MKTLFCLLLLVSPVAGAAQLGKIVVEQAAIYEYPQIKANIIGRARKGNVYQVSNLPTEGYFKARISSNEYGWISGNDILVTPGSGGGEVTSAALDSAPTPDSAKQKTEIEEEFFGAKTRFLFGIGLHDALYNGLSDHFSGTDQMNFGKNYSLEIQRRWFYLLYWAVRAEIVKGDSGDQSISATTTQRLTSYGLPVQLGVIFHPWHTRKFRLGIGGYLGASVVTYTNVDQTISAVTTSTKYSSIDPVGTLSVQGTYGLGKVFGIFAEFAFRYQQTGSMAPTSPPTGAVPAFKINYSAYSLKGGLELRF